MPESYTIEFDGYWLHEGRSAVPAGPGVFSVYSCRPAGSGERPEVQRLLYVGRSRDVRSALETPERLGEWQAFLQPCETLCYGVGKVGASDLARCAAALVFRHKPPANDSCVYRFPYPDTMVTLRGRTALLCPHFTILRGKL